MINIVSSCVDTLSHSLKTFSIKRSAMMGANPEMMKGMEAMMGANPEVADMLKDPSKMQARRAADATANPRVDGRLRASTP